MIILVENGIEIATLNLVESLAGYTNSQVWLSHHHVWGYCYSSLDSHMEFLSKDYPDGVFVFVP